MIVREGDELALQRHVVDGSYRWVEDIERVDWTQVEPGGMDEVLERLWLIAEDEAGGLLPVVAGDVDDDWLLRTTPLRVGRLDETKNERDYGAIYGGNGVG
jgi:hypothetical protein